MFNITQEQSRENCNRIIGDFCNRHRRLFLSMRLKGDFTWVHEFTKLRFFDRDWLLWPITKWDYPGIVVACTSSDGKEEAKLVMRFLSALAWIQGKKVQEDFWVTGTNANAFFRQEALPDSPFSRGNELSIDEHDYLPFPQEEKEQIALALYREALGVDENTYKFLSFFKILNIKLGTAREQKQWINANIDKISGPFAKEEVTKLKLTTSDIGSYLYESGRCAVAHAYNQPVINPDNPEDKRRLSAELPIIRALAELMIEQEFGIKSRSTLFREHLYELAGFKKIIGDDLIKLVLEEYDLTAEGEDIGLLIEQRLPKLSVRLRGEPERPHENLVPSVVQIKDGMVTLQCVSEDDLVQVYLGLDFKNERLQFDAVRGFMGRDNGSAYAAKIAASQTMFVGKLFCNGALDVFSEDESLLGRKDAYLPNNMVPNDKHIERAKQYEEVCTLRTIGRAPKLPKIRIEDFLSTTTLKTNK